MAAPVTSYAIHPDGVAVLTLTNPPLNALHPDVLKSLFTHLNSAHNDPKVHAIVVVGAGKAFCAGFDINQFVSQSGAEGVSDSTNEYLYKFLETGPKPTVAAIAGVALGGGLEVAMACNARVAAPGSKLGLPELQLGIIPGFGGTQRLPRLVGLKQAAEMMLTSKQISAEEGLKLGLVDQVVPQDQLLAVAKQYALEIAQARRPRLLSLFRTDKLEPLGEALAILDFATEQTAKKARGVKHPLLCLEAIRVGVEHGGLAGIKKEGEMFAAAQKLDTHKALVHIFFATRSTKKIRGVTDAGLKPRPMKTVAVLGGGLMGSGIATALALANVDVLIKEVNQKFLDGGLQRVRSNIESRVRKGAMKKPAAEAAIARVKGVLDYAQFGNVDLVIEAVIEDIPLKQQIFLDLEKACRPDAILSSNTSTIDLDVIGAKTRAQDRIVGAHFFSPAHVMPLLEIVRTKTTSKQVLVDLLDLSTRIKKTPVVVGNCTGFAVNRVFFPYTMAACMMIDCGLADNPYAVDAAIAGTFGMPMGPFRLNDLVGSDISFHVGKNFLDSFPERTYPGRIINLLHKNGRLGEKSGKGFYQYDAKRKASPDPEIAALIKEARSVPGPTWPPQQRPAKLSSQEIIEFIFFPVVNEGCRVIDEGIVDKPADLDAATVLSMGFPPYRGGIIFWADLVGAKYIVDKLNALAAAAPPPLRGFFEPCSYLKAAAASGRRLGDGTSPRAKM